MTESTLDNLLRALPKRTSSHSGYDLNVIITGNPGARTCRTGIAVAKGWRVETVHYN